MLGDRRSAEKRPRTCPIPGYLLKCDALSYEEVVKTVRTSLRRSKELRQVRDFSPSMLLYGTLPLFGTNFRRCHALLSLVTSSLASPIVVLKGNYTAHPYSPMLQNFFLLSLMVEVWGQTSDKNMDKQTAETGHKIPSDAHAAGMMKSMSSVNNLRL